MNNNFGIIGKELGLPSINELDLRKNHGIFVKIGIVSETTGFFISRNNEATETTSENFFNEERLVVPASKWRGAERSYLLSELRKVQGVIPEKYNRNMISKKELLKNPSSLIFGDSSTGSGKEAAGVASRVFYDWAYSYEALPNISLRLTHNSLSDEGTILHEPSGKVMSQAIYNSPYIKPGVRLIRYVTAENISIEMLALVLMAIMGTTRYGARTAILGDNMKNKICALGFSKTETPVSSFTSMQACWSGQDYEPEKMILKDMENAYKNHLLYGEKMEKLLNSVVSLRNNVEELKEMCDLITVKMGRDWEDFFK